MYEEYLNKTFNKWTIVQFSHKDKYNHPHFICKCSCGKIKTIDLFALKYGKSKSCLECARNTSYTIKHNLSHSRLYKIYYGIKSRCNNPKNIQYKNYGKRGICMCKQWNDSFIDFYNWSIQNGYADCLTIDRIDVNGNYNPNNCRWVDIKTQANNKRTNNIIEYNGHKYTLTQFCKEFNLNKATVEQRIYKYGYKNPELLLKKSLKGNIITLNGQTKSLKDWCRTLNVNYGTIRNRIYKQGFSIEEAFNTPIIKRTRKT